MYSICYLKLYAVMQAIIHRDQYLCYKEFVLHSAKTHGSIWSLRGISILQTQQCIVAAIQLCNKETK